MHSDCQVRFERALLAIGALASGAAWLAPDAVRAQSAQEIVTTAVERYAERVADAENYTLVQQMNGAPQTVYYEKRSVDGRPVFEPLTAADLALSEAGMASESFSR